MKLRTNGARTVLAIALRATAANLPLLGDAEGVRHSTRRQPAGRSKNKKLLAGSEWHEAIKPRPASR